VLTHHPGMTEFAHQRYAANAPKFFAAFQLRQ
jgi:hypothetical protein